MIAQEVQKVLPELVEEDPQYGELSLKYSNAVKCTGCPHYLK